MGCEKDDANKIETRKVSVCVFVLWTAGDCSRCVLTSLVGDLEGTLVGRSVICGSSVGSAVGFRGDWLGLDVG